MHEASLYEDNCFVTLTYSPENLPSHGTLVKSHLSKFIRALRDQIRPWKVRFYACGEYGDQTLRPHYHVLLFNYDFLDKYIWRNSNSGFPVYRSDQLEKLWTFGNSELGTVTYQSAGYCARYALKKITGKHLDVIDPKTCCKPYERLDKNTGEIIAIVPEYTTMSTHPGIAKAWYEKYKDDVFPDDFCVVKGKRVPTPKYYRSLLEQEDPELAADLRRQRETSARSFDEDNTYARLNTRDKVAAARAHLLIRSYETGI